MHETHLKQMSPSMKLCISYHSHIIIFIEDHYIHEPIIEDLDFMVYELYSVLSYLQILEMFGILLSVESLYPQLSTGLT